MSNEAQVRAGLTIRKVDPTTGIIQIAYNGGRGAFQATVTGAKGPSPGAFTADTDGTDVDFSNLQTPGLALFRNLDLTNFVTYGIRDPESDLFFPLGEILPGEEYVFRLSRNLQEQQVGTSTGTSGGSTNRLHFRADTAPVNVSVEAFEV